MSKDRLTYRKLREVRALGRQLFGATMDDPSTMRGGITRQHPRCTLQTGLPVRHFSKTEIAERQAKENM